MIKTDNLSLSYRHPNIIGSQLNAENILTYFCDANNPFYVRGSDNETLRMQNINLARQDMLEKMNGIQYQVFSANPPLFVIRKIQRNSLTEITPLAYYYVLDGTIYQAPDLYSVFQSRICCALKPLQNAINETLNLINFDVAEGHQWDFKRQFVKSNNDENDEKDSNNSHKFHNRLEENLHPSQERGTMYHQTNVDALLKILVAKFPPTAPEKPLITKTIKKELIEPTQQSKSATSQQSKSNFDSENVDNTTQQSTASSTIPTNIEEFKTKSLIANAPTPPATFSTNTTQSSATETTQNSMEFSN